MNENSKKIHSKPRGKIMQTRFNYAEAAPDAYQAVFALEQYVAEESGLEPA
jgi:hypothetical protein